MDIEKKIKKLRTELKKYNSGLIENKKAMCYLSNYYETAFFTSNN